MITTPPCTCCTTQQDQVTDLPPAKTRDLPRWHFLRVHQLVSEFHTMLRYFHNTRCFHAAVVSQYGIPQTPPPPPPHTRVRSPGGRGMRPLREPWLMRTNTQVKAPVFVSFAHCAVGGAGHAACVTRCANSNTQVREHCCVGGGRVPRATHRVWKDANTWKRR